MEITTDINSHLRRKTQEKGRRIKGNLMQPTWNSSLRKTSRSILINFFTRVLKVYCYIVSHV